MPRSPPFFQSMLHMHPHVPRGILQRRDPQQGGFRRESTRVNGHEWAGVSARFCNECGSRPLPGPYRYQLGEIWHEGGTSSVRCIRCEECKPFDVKTRARCCVQVCPDCARSEQKGEGRGHVQSSMDGLINGSERLSCSALEKRNGGGTDE